MVGELPSLSNTDWLSQVLSHLRFTPLSIFIVLAVVSFVRDVLSALAFNGWLPTNNRAGLSTEPVAWLWDCLSGSIIFAYFIWIQKAADRVFTRLSDEGVIELGEPITRELSNGQMLLRNRWLSRVAFLVGLAYAIWYVLAFTQPPSQAPIASWITANPAIVVIGSPFAFIAFYALCMLLYDMAIFLHVLDRVLRCRPIHVTLLSPDGSGGFGSIGNFTANLGYLIGSFGLTLSVAIVSAPSHTLYFHLTALTALYLILAPLFFILPLWTTHRKMVDYRDSLVTEIAVECDKALAQLRAGKSKEPAEIEPLLAKIRQLDEMRGLAMRYPTWPFNFNNTRKYISLVASPLLPGAVSVIAAVISSKIAIP